MKIIPIDFVNNLTYNCRSEQLSVTVGNISYVFSKELTNVIRKLLPARDNEGSLFQPQAEESPKHYTFNALWPHGVVNSPIWFASRDRHIPITEMDASHITNTLKWLDKRITTTEKEKSYIERLTSIDIVGHEKALDYWKRWVTKFQMELDRRAGK